MSAIHSNFGDTSALPSCCNFFSSDKQFRACLLTPFPPQPIPLSALSPSAEASRALRSQNRWTDLRCTHATRSHHIQSTFWYSGRSPWFFAVDHFNGFLKSIIQIEYRPDFDQSVQKRLAANPPRRSDH